MMKRNLLLMVAILLLGGSSAVCAQARKSAAAFQSPAPERQGTVYYTPKQNPLTYTIWVDDIEFGPEATVVTMHYLRARGGANLSPSTRLICRLRGGKTRVLGLRYTQGISMKKDRYTQLGRGEVFRAYFPALDPADAAKVRSVDFMEDPSGRAGGNVFNITGIKISKKNLVVR